MDKRRGHYLDDEHILLLDRIRMFFKLVEELGEVAVEGSRYKGKYAVEHQRYVPLVRIFSVYLQEHNTRIGVQGRHYERVCELNMHNAIDLKNICGH